MRLSHASPDRSCHVGHTKIFRLCVVILGPCRDSVQEGRLSLRVMLYDAHQRVHHVLRQGSDVSRFPHRESAGSGI